MSTVFVHDPRATPRGMPAGCTAGGGWIDSFPSSPWFNHYFAALQRKAQILHDPQSSGNDSEILEAAAGVVLSDAARHRAGHNKSGICGRRTLEQDGEYCPRYL